MMAVNIQWEIDMYKVCRIIDDMPVRDTVLLLGVPEYEYSRLHLQTRHDLIFDVLRSEPALMTKILGLPDSVEIPDNVKERNIPGWLARHCHCRHKGYELISSNSSP